MTKEKEIIQSRPAESVHSPTANYGHAVVCTETKFSLIWEDDAQITSAVDNIFGGVTRWDICKKCFPHMVLADKPRLEYIEKLVIPYSK